MFVIGLELTVLIGRVCSTIVYIYLDSSVLYRYLLGSVSNCHALLEQRVVIFVSLRSNSWSGSGFLQGNTTFVPSSVDVKG